MLRSALILIISFFAVWADCAAADAKGPVDLLVVAGQSNAVGYDAKPSELPADPADKEILFWWRCGDPPPDEHDTTSGGKWLSLQAQPLGNPKRPRQNRQYGNFAQPEGGFGPEIGLARTLHGRERKPLAVVKAAFSGTGMKRDWNHADAGDGGSCYRALVAETRAAVAAAKKQGITLRPRALAWVQGESDANATDSTNYAHALGEMIAALRRDLEAPELVALVAVNTKFGGGRNQFMPVIVDQQRKLASSDPRIEYVDTSSATIANNAHFDSKGTLEVGRLFADALADVEAKLNAERRRVTIVTLGDSITKGVRGGVTKEQTFASLLESKLQADGVSARVINVGIGGERTDQALRRLDRVIELKPDIVTVMYGTNDSYVDRGKKASRITREAYHKNLTRIVVELSRRGIEPVLMTEPRWADEAGTNGLGEHPNVRLEPFVKSCRDVAKARRVPLVDHFSEWTAAREEGVKLLEWTTDGCHPNPAGHIRLVETMLPIIRRAIGPELKFRAKLLGGETVRVVCFGDSVTGVYYHTGSRRAYTDMLGIALRRAGPQAKVEMINAGISGHTTTNGLARMDRDVLGHNPDLVTVMFGLNDMTRLSIEQYKKNLKKIVAKCRAAGSEVALATPNNVIDTPNRPTEKLLRYCDAVREVGRELRVPVCDCYRELDAARSHDESNWRLLMSDEIHPNMDGHQRMATALAQTVTGFRMSLADVPPYPLALRRTIQKLRKEQTLSVLAMPPFDKLITPAIRDHFPKANVKVETWPVDGLSIAKIEASAKDRVRKSKPDLVVIAVPRSAMADVTEQEIGSYTWTMNWSLNFGSPTWDCVVAHPSVVDYTKTNAEHDDIVRRLVPAQDLSLIDRAAGDASSAEKILTTWLGKQFERGKATTKQAGID